MHVRSFTPPNSLLVLMALPSFAITMGPVSWTYPAEIFPMRVRAKAISLSTASNWLFNFALAWAVPPGLSNIAYKTYFIFGTFNVAAFIHVYLMYPETAGRTLEEVEEIFVKGNTFTAWRVDRSVGRKTLQQVVELKEYFARATVHPRPSVTTVSNIALPYKAVSIEKAHDRQSDGHVAGSIISRNLQETNSLELQNKKT
jgi:hypothetical protein